MPKNGPILIVEDDQDDQLFLQQILQELEVKNRLLFFENAKDLIPFLMDTTERPFLILSDMNLPGMDGTDLRKELNSIDHLRKKSIPFIFFTTTARRESVEKAYEMMVQGYFEKPPGTAEFKQTLKTILDYWKLCKHPNAPDDLSR